MYSDIDLTPLRRRPDTPLRRVGFGLLRATLLFSTACVLLALIVAPAADRRAQQYADRHVAMPDVDLITTGSIGGSSGTGHQYIVRRTVLSPDPEIICMPGESAPAGVC